MSDMEKLRDCAFLFQGNLFGNKEIGLIWNSHVGRCVAFTHPTKTITVYHR